jgi:hypothetical protein
MWLKYHHLQEVITWVQEELDKLKAGQTILDSLSFYLYEVTKTSVVECVFF